MEFLPEPTESGSPTISGKSQHLVQEVEELIDRANAQAKNGMVKDVDAQVTKKNFKASAVLSNIIEMDCGTSTCANVKRIANDYKSSTSPCRTATTNDACIAPYCTWNQDDVNVMKYNSKSYKPGVYTVQDAKGKNIYLLVQQGADNLITDYSEDIRKALPSQYNWIGADIVFQNVNKDKCTANINTSTFYGCWGGCTDPAASTNHLCHQFQQATTCPDGMVKLNDVQTPTPDGFGTDQLGTACQQWYMDTQVPDANQALERKEDTDALRQQAVAACAGPNMCVSTKESYHKQFVPVNKDGKVRWCSEVGMRQVPNFGSVGLEESNCTVPVWEYNGLPKKLQGYGVDMENLVVSGTNQAKCTIENIVMTNDNPDQTEALANTMVDHSLQKVDLQKVRDAMQLVASKATQGIDWPQFAAAQNLASSVMNASQQIRQAAVQECGKQSQTRATNYIHQTCSPAWEKNEAKGCSISGITMGNAVQSQMKTCLQQASIDRSAMMNVAQQIDQLSSVTADNREKQRLPFDPHVANKWLTWGGLGVLLCGLLLPLCWERTGRAMLSGLSVGGMVVSLSILVLGGVVLVAFPKQQQSTKRSVEKAFGGLSSTSDEPLKSVCGTLYAQAKTTMVSDKTVEQVQRLCELNETCEAWSFQPETSQATTAPLSCNAKECLEDPSKCTLNGKAFGTCCRGNSVPVVDEAPTGETRLWCVSCEETKGAGVLYHETVPEACLPELEKQCHPSAAGLACFPGMGWAGIRQPVQQDKHPIAWETAGKRLLWLGGGVLVGCAVVWYVAKKQARS